MPELPEIETIRREMMPHLEGQWFTTVTVRQPRLRWPVPDNLAQILVGQHLHQIHRRGKYLLFQCSQGHLLIHLGMSGSLRILSLNTPVKKHDHIDFEFTGNICLRYHDPRRFGCVLWTTAPILNHPLLANLGPEPLTDEFTGKYLYHLAKQRQLTVKEYIMDAHVVVGVGNIYANEALFLARIHPARAAGQIGLSRYQRLVESIQQVLQAAIEQGGTTLRDYVTTTGEEGNFKTYLHVYGRAGEACRQCGKPIQTQKMGQRSTYFCSNCQK